MYIVSAYKICRGKGFLSGVQVHIGMLGLANLEEVNWIGEHAVALGDETVY